MNFKSGLKTGGGRVLKLVFDGVYVCGPRSETPLPISKDFSPGLILRCCCFFFFSFKFGKSGPISKGFSTSKMAEFTFCPNFFEMGPSSKDLFDQNGTHV